MTFDEIDILIGVDRRLKHILGAHSDSVQWYENQVRQTLRWIEETRRRREQRISVTDVMRSRTLL